MLWPWIGIGFIIGSIFTWFGDSLVRENVQLSEIQIMVFEGLFIALTFWWMIYWSVKMIEGLHQLKEDINEMNKKQRKMK
jgi:hypothetical protein